MWYICELILVNIKCVINTYELNYRYYIRNENGKKNYRDDLHTNWFDLGNNKNENYKQRYMQRKGGHWSIQEAKKS